MSDTTPQLLFGVDVSALVGLLQQPPGAPTTPTSTAPGGSLSGGGGGRKPARAVGAVSPAIATGIAPRPATQPLSHSEAKRLSAGSPVRGASDTASTFVSGSVRDSVWSPGPSDDGSFGGGSSLGFGALAGATGNPLTSSVSLGSTGGGGRGRQRRHKKSTCDRCSRHMLCATAHLEDLSRTQRPLETVTFASKSQRFALKPAAGQASLADSQLRASVPLSPLAIKTARGVKASPAHDFGAGVRTSVTGLSVFGLENPMLSVRPPLSPPPAFTKAPTSSLPAPSQTHFGSSTREHWGPDTVYYPGFPHPDPRMCTELHGDPSLPRLHRAQSFSRSPKLQDPKVVAPGAVYEVPGTVGRCGSAVFGSEPRADPFAPGDSPSPGPKYLGVVRGRRRPSPSFTSSGRSAVLDPKPSYAYDD